MDNAINGQRAMTADVTMPRVGAWHSDVESDGAEKLSGAVTLTVEGLPFVGTIIRSGVSGGRVKSKVVGGKGKLPTELPGKNYASGVRVRNVIDDILRECGETLSPTSETAVLAHFLGKWERSAGKASVCLVDVLEPVGAIWRVLADGTIWVGANAFPAQKIEHLLLDEDWVAGMLELAPERPDLRPGVTIHDQQISYVVHRLRPDSLRTEAYVVDSPGNHLEKLLSRMRREVDFSRKYSGRVVSQSGNTLQVIPDDPKLKGKGVGTGLDKVAIRTGFPGEVKVPAGARVMIGFDGGDPDKPYAEGWDGTTYDEIRLGNGTLPAGRQGDLVIVTPSVTAVTALAGVLFCALPGAPPTINPATLDPTNPLKFSVPIQFTGVISTGNPKIKE
jgi:hypothetical protein